MLTFNLKTTFFTVKTSNEVYCCRIYFVNYIQNVHIINRTLHGSLEDMDFMFSWQEQYLTRSLRSLVRYCSCHSNIKSISSRNRVISYIYVPQDIAQLMNSILNRHRKIILSHPIWLQNLSEYY